MQRELLGRVGEVPLPEISTRCPLITRTVRKEGVGGGVSPHLTHRRWAMFNFALWFLN